MSDPETRSEGFYWMVLGQNRRRSRIGSAASGGCAVKTGRGNRGGDAAICLCSSPGCLRWRRHLTMAYSPLLAEGVGFEPTVRFHAHTLSKRAP